MVTKRAVDLKVPKNDRSPWSRRLQVLEDVTPTRITEGGSRPGLAGGDPSLQQLEITTALPESR